MKTRRFLIFSIFILVISVSIIFFSQATTNSLLAVAGTEKMIVTVRTNSSYSIGYDGIGQVSCNSDEMLTGGGYNSSFHDALSVYQNGPSADGKKWIVGARYTPGNGNGGIFHGPAPTFSTYALCAKTIS